LVEATILKNCYSYWQQILSSDVNSFTHIALLANQVLDRNGYNSYYSRIKAFLATLELRDKIYIIPKKQIKNEAKRVCLKYRDMYISHFFQTLNDIGSQTLSKGKFDIYCRIKKQYHREKYLTNINKFKLRKVISGIRCASNIIPINLLRKSYIKREARFCNMCNTQQLGTVMHIITLCQNSKIVELREKCYN
jgi:hypothetical protein